MQVTGEGIRQVSLSVDKGGFYRWRRLEDLSQEQMQELREAQAAEEVFPASIDQAADGTWSSQEAVYLGNTVTEAYDPAVRYGFWVPGLPQKLWEEDIRSAANSSVEIGRAHV